MASYKDSRARQSRKIGVDLNLFVKSLEQKTKFSEQKPGQSAKRRPPSSKFGEGLNAVQTLVCNYGIRTGKLSNYMAKARRMNGSTDEMLMQLLESRLDNVVHTMGFAVTKRQARQMVTHKHITVNGKVLSCPSYAVQPGDVIAVAEKAKEQQRVVMSVDLAKERKPVEWLECDYTALSGVYRFHPTIEHINLVDHHMLGLVIVYFSK